MRSIVFAVCALGVGASCEPEQPAPVGGCAVDDRAMDYVAGLEVDSEAGDFRATLIEVDGGAPLRGKNAWTLGIEPLGDTPDLPALSLDVEPFMPDHNHGSALAPEITTEADGTVLAEQIDLFMGGLWEVRVIATWTDATMMEHEDRAVFAFCIE